MGDGVLAALVIVAALVAAAAALAVYTARLDGKGSVSQAPGPPVRHAAICGVHGPSDFVCDLPPHNGWRHEQDGIGWTVQGGPDRRPAHLGEMPKPGGGR